MKRFNTTGIVLHHTVTPQDWGKVKTVNAISKFHGGKPHYHYLIGHNWTWRSDDPESVKYHAGNYPVNLVSVAVSLVGDFTKDKPTKYQEKALKSILEDLMRQYGLTRDRIKLHNEVRLKPTACPGVTQEYIDKLMEDKERQEYKKEIAELNYEIGIVTPQRDGALKELEKEKKGHKETLEKLTAERRKREEAERKLKECTKNKFQSLSILEKIRILVK